MGLKVDDIKNLPCLDEESFLEKIRNSPDVSLDSGFSYIFHYNRSNGSFVKLDIIPKMETLKYSKQNFFSIYKRLVISVDNEKNVFILFWGKQTKLVTEYINNQWISKMYERS